MLVQKYRYLYTYLIELKTVMLNILIYFIEFPRCCQPTTTSRSRLYPLGAGGERAAARAGNAATSHRCSVLAGALLSRATADRTISLVQIPPPGAITGGEACCWGARRGERWLTLLQSPPVAAPAAPSLRCAQRGPPSAPLWQRALPQAGREVLLDGQIRPRCQLTLPTHVGARTHLSS